MAPLRLGVTEHRNDQGGFFQGAGWAGIELIIGLILGPFLALALGYTIYVWWPDIDRIVAVAMTITLLVVGISWLLLYVIFRIVAIVGAWNRGKAIHVSDQGATFAHQGRVLTHSHVQPPPINVVEEPEDEYADDFGPPNAIVATGRKPPRTFKDMLRMGYGTEDGEIVLAFEDNGNPITLPDLTSIGIGGVQGSGKTVTTLVLMLGIIRKFNGRVKFLVVDPQLYAQGDQSLASKVKELQPFFLEAPNLANPTVGTGELPGWMAFIQAEMERRRSPGGEWRDVWVVVIDEFVHVVNTTDGAGVLPVLESINRTARQLGIFAILVSQEWLASRLGGTELRHAIATFAIHNMPEQIAELIAPPDVARQAPRMRVGQLLFNSLGRIKVGRVVFADATDSQNAVVRYATPINRWSVEVDNANNVPEVTTISPEAYQALTGEPIPSTVESTLLPMPPLSELNRLPPAEAYDGLPMGIDPQKARQIQAAFVEGLSVSDTATQVLGSRSEGNMFKVRETQKWLVGRGLD